jgi:anti-sigma B factor antagonist
MTHPEGAIMRISSNSTGDSTTLHIHSTRLDAAAAHELRSSLSEAVTATPGPTVIDMSDVLFMDSSGLGALIGALKVGAAGKIAITGVTPAVRTVFRLTRVDRALKIIE